MAISPVTQANVPEVGPKPTVTPVIKGATQSKPQPTATDTVQISSAGKAAFQEATETPAQTAQEARSGDPQAQRKLAREAAAEETNESPAAKAKEAQGA
jgi:hypothetical protein